MVFRIKDKHPICKSDFQTKNYQLYSIHLGGSVGTKSTIGTNSQADWDSDSGVGIQHESSVFTLLRENTILRVLDGSIQVIDGKGFSSMKILSQH